MNIGRSINVALAKRDMKRADLMRSFGWSPAYVSKICKSSEIGMGSVQKLSEFLIKPAPQGQQKQRSGKLTPTR
jgi:DNA-binding Xre family transcriptional regulator